VLGNITPCAAFVGFLGGICDYFFSPFEKELKHKDFNRLEIFWYSFTIIHPLSIGIAGLIMDPTLVLHYLQKFVILEGIIRWNAITIQSLKVFEDLRKADTWPMW
jgi:hypothetical protein